MSRGEVGHRWIRSGPGDAVTFGELLGQSSNGNVSSFCGRSNQRNRGTEGVSPVVVGMPPDHFVEQIGLETASHRRTRQDRILDLAVVTTAELTFGKMGLAETFVGDRVITGDRCDVESVGGESHEHLTGKCVVVGVEVGYRRIKLVHVCTAGQAGQQAPERFETILFRWSPSHCHPI